MGGGKSKLRRLKVEVKGIPFTRQHISNTSARTSNNNTRSMDLNSKGQSRPIDRMQTWHSAGSTGREASLTGKQHPVELNAASSTQWRAAR